MLRRRLCWLLVAAILLGAMCVALAGEFPISTRLGEDMYPSINNQRVVWISIGLDDNFNEITTLYSYDLVSHQEIALTSSYSYRYGLTDRYAVWKDTRSMGDYYPGPDIYGYDFTTALEFPIAVASHYKSDPAIAGDWVVWYGYDPNASDLDGFYAYNLATGITKRLANFEATPSWGPIINGNLLIWADVRNGNDDIYGYNLVTDEEFPICTNSGGQGVPLASGNYVVWTDTRSDPSATSPCCYSGEGDDIYGYDLTAGEEFPICTKPGRQMPEAIFGNIVVWTEGDQGYSVIYGYDLVNRRMLTICRAPGNRALTTTWYRSPSSFPSDLIVWGDTRDFPEPSATYRLYGYDPNSGQEFCIAPDADLARGDYVVDRDYIIWSDSRDDTLYGWLHNTNLYSIAMPAVPTNTISIDKKLAVAGTSLVIPIHLHADDAAAGAQFDFTYDPNLLTLVGITENTSPSLDWTLDWEQIEPGRARVAAYSTSATGTRGGLEIAYVHLTVSAEAQANTHLPLYASNIEVVDGQGEKLFTGLIPGEVAIVPQIDHFAVTLIPAPPEPQGADPNLPLPFTLHVEAQNANNEIETLYNGTAGLLCEGLRLSRYQLDLADGVWEGDFAIKDILSLSNAELLVKDLASGTTSSSPAFNIRTKYDVNGDDNVTIADVIKAISILLKRPLSAFPRAEYQNWAADTDGNGEVNVFDILQIVSRSLGRHSALTAAQAKAKPVTISLLPDGRHGFKLLVMNAKELAGLQFDISATDTAASAGPAAKGWNVDGEVQNGKKRIIAYSPKAAGVNSTSGVLLQLKTRLTRLQLSAILASDANGHALPVVVK
jgi:beta propeller repeat protein